MKNIMLSGLFGTILKTRELKIKEKKLSLNLEKKDLATRTDIDKLAFVLTCLIDNAIKFSKEGGQIDVNYQETHNGVEISVSDNGVGMTSEAKELLFKPFTRGTSTLQFDYEGMGTNLYIAKMITNYLGGDITVESKIDKGTKVRVEIEK